MPRDREAIAYLIEGNRINKTDLYKDSDRIPDSQTTTDEQILAIVKEDENGRHVPVSLVLSVVLPQIPLFGPFGSWAGSSRRSFLSQAFRPKLRSPGAAQKGETL